MHGGFRASGGGTCRRYPRTIETDVAPPPHVVTAFGGAGKPERLAGGRGIAWKVGDRILKPVDVTPIELEWQATALSTQPRDGFRLSTPIRAVDGSFVVDGWAAWPALAGQHEEGRWVDVIEVGRRFHRAIEPLDRPNFIDERTDPWSIGDRVAWGDAPDTPYRKVPFVAELLDRLRPPSTSDQLVHGDLTGNVLFADDEPPAIIDLSLYWRPVGYATAIVVADAIVWEGAGDELLQYALQREMAFGQLLARALVFRLVAADRAIESRSGIHRRYRHAVEIAHSLIEGSR
jgi:uncharacterized protein (TIGR02569 family)